MKLEWPDPLLGKIEIEIGELKREEYNPEHLKEAKA